MTRRSHPALALGLSALLSACGGGGGDAPPPPSACQPASFQVSADATVAVGKAAGAALASACGPVSAVLWRQTAGPAVDLLSARTQAISFEPAAAGTYGFAVDFRDADGVQRSAAVTVDAVAPPTPVAVLVRTDQAVREGGKASVRAWPAAASGETITWTQVSGPTVALDAEGDQNRVLFTAPAVVQDTVIVLRATKQLAGGGSDSDDVRVLVENYEQAPADPSGTGPYIFSDSHVSRVYPYRQNGPFAGALVRCTYEANLQYTGSGANLCPLATLPFLHQTTGGAVPTVAQIMDRVLVSHDWMGQVFEQFLTTQANIDDLKRLFNGVTAIVIGAHVRPSFYFAATGAIHLDADNFWLTAAQRDVIDETPDFRSEFDRLLKYSSLWRYVEGSQNIFRFFDPTDRELRDRNLAYLAKESNWLLYHELAHASDFMPPDARASLDSTRSAWENIAARSANIPSTTLAATYPLTSQTMFGLAQVKFFGATPTAEQQSYTPEQVGEFFRVDRATDEYSYARPDPTSTPREDLAMLFEEFMMYRNHGWRRDVAFSNKIVDGSNSTSLFVAWGQRGRIGETAIKPRARTVVGALAPWVALAEVDALPAPLPMRAGESWASNLTLPAPPTGLATVQALRSPAELAADRALLMRSLSGVHERGSPNDRWLKRAGR